MPELGEATLQVSYKGAEISEQVLEKLFAAILREIETRGTQDTKRTKAASITKKNAKTLGQQFRTSDIDRAAKELNGGGVLFQVLKQPGQEPEYALFFKGKDMATIEKALKSLDGDRTIEKKPERSELAPKEQGFHEYELAAQAREKAALLDNSGEPNIFDRLQPKTQDNSRNKGKPRIFTGKDLQDDIRMARESVNIRNAQRAATRPPKAPSRGLGR